MSPINYTCYLVAVLLICSISSTVLADNWSKILDITKQIYDQQETIAPDAMITKLVEIKSFRTQLSLSVPANIPHREHIMIGLSLYKIVMAVNNERCLQSKNYHHTTSYHTSNFIEMYGVLHHFFESSNMRKIIELYYRIQLMTCQDNILANFHIKYSSIIENPEGKKLDKFKEILVKSFAIHSNVDNFTAEDRITGFVRFLLHYFDRDQLVSNALGRQNGIIELMRQILYADCANHYLNPLHTIMMTYNIMKRNSDKVNEEFGQMIRGYDLCLYLRGAVLPSELAEVEKRVMNLIGVFLSITGKVMKRPQESQLPSETIDPVTPLDPIAPLDPIEPHQPGKRARLTINPDLETDREANLVTQYSSFEPDLTAAQVVDEPEIITQPTRQELPEPDISLSLPLQLDQQQQQQQQQQQKPVVPKKGLTFDLNDNSDSDTQ